MAYTYYKHASIDWLYPRALAMCDRCGLTYNHFALKKQFEWQGAKTRDIGYLVCPSCFDKLQEQRRQFIIPPNPIPIEHQRVEPAIVELGLEPDGTVPYPYGTLAAPSNTTALINLTNPAPPNVTDPTAVNAGATSPSSYFSINQDLGIN